MTTFHNKYIENITLKQVQNTHYTVAKIDNIL